MRLIHLLRESITVHPKFVIEVSSNRNLTRAQFKPLETRLNEYPGNSWAGMENEVISVEFDKLNATELQTDKLETLGNDVIESIEYALADYGTDIVQYNTNKIMCDGGLPPFPVSCRHTVDIVCKSNTIISGISKLITGCGMLEINDIEKLHPQGVLDILRLPRKVEAIQFGWTGAHPQWTGIIHDHFEGERDLLDCKEELMNAGLKEWAKL